MLYSLVYIAIDLTIPTRHTKRTEHFAKKTSGQPIACFVVLTKLKLQQTNRKHTKTNSDMHPVEKRFGSIFVTRNAHRTFSRSLYSTVRMFKGVLLRREGALVPSKIWFDGPYNALKCKKPYNDS